eukprot:TRINITY_DN11080_c0_g1_i2.p1 TRINITY_DN11080_c0_g1~~TRINITY_DN11080_c0_g1_i2.p1  ORF type:complete len:194 (+),score=58.93 TRINITY_DN11080_c0_g1_i2:64-645(+)
MSQTKESVAAQLTNLLQLTQRWAEVNQKLTASLTSVTNIDAEISCVQTENYFAAFQEFRELSALTQHKLYIERQAYVLKADGQVQELERMIEKMKKVYDIIERYATNERESILFQTAPTSTFLLWCSEIQEMHLKELASVKYLSEKIKLSQDQQETICYLKALQLEPHIDNDRIITISRMASAETQGVVPMIS